MLCKQAIAGLVRHSAILAFSVPTACLAAGGALLFQGAITEPACAVSAVHAGFSQAMLQRLSSLPGMASIDAGAMQLTMRCNARQSVDVSFESRFPATSDAEAAGVDVVLSRVGRDLRPGEAIPVTLDGRSENNLAIHTALRKTSGSDVRRDGRMGGTMLISVHYR